MIRERAVFDEGSLVEEDVESLPHRELPELALPRDAIRSAHLESGFLALPHVVDERRPVVEIVGHGKERTLTPRMRRGVVVVAMSLAILVACTDNKPPTGRASSSASNAVSSGSDQVLARSMARTLADGIQQGAAGRVTSAQADCLVNEISTHVDTTALTSIASGAPDPKTLPKDVRQSFGAAFDKCLSKDIATQLKKSFGL